MDTLKILGTQTGNIKAVFPNKLTPLIIREEKLFYKKTSNIISKAWCASMTQNNLVLPYSR